jgi:hypothetical protein
MTNPNISDREQRSNITRFRACGKRRYKHWLPQPVFRNTYYSLRINRIDWSSN